MCMRNAILKNAIIADSQFNIFASSTKMWVFWRLKQLYEIKKKYDVNKSLRAHYNK